MRAEAASRVTHRVPLFSDDKKDTRSSDAKERAWQIAFDTLIAHSEKLLASSTEIVQAAMARLLVSSYSACSPTLAHAVHSFAGSR